MIKNRKCLFLLLVIFSCSVSPDNQVKDQLARLSKMERRAAEIISSSKNKKGADYLKARDRYYEIMHKRTNDAMQFLSEADPSRLTINELKNLVQMAVIAQNEQKIIDIVKMVFDQYPESKQDKRLLKIYFPNAYLLEPAEIEKYVDITLFTPNEQLECYYALALGFAEWGKNEQAEKYLAEGNDLLKQLVAEKIQRNTIPVVRLAGLRSYIAYKLGDTASAFSIIDEAKKEFTDEYSAKQLGLYETRLRISGKTAKSIEYQFWLGPEQPVDLAALKGKVVLLNFFTWSCETCTTSLPSLFALKQEWDNDHVVMIGVTQHTGGYEHDQDISEIKEYEYLRDHYYKKRKIDWPVYITRNTGMDGYGISSYPAYILIDKDGIIRDGYFISNYSYLKKKIERLLSSTE